MAMYKVLLSLSLALLALSGCYQAIDCGSFLVERDGTCACPAGTEFVADPPSCRLMDGGVVLIGDGGSSDGGVRDAARDAGARDGGADADVGASDGGITDSGSDSGPACYPARMYPRDMIACDFEDECPNTCESLDTARQCTEHLCTVCYRTAVMVPAGQYCDPEGAWQETCPRPCPGTTGFRVACSPEPDGTGICVVRLE
jgi:hypothetical protein